MKNRFSFLIVITFCVAFLSVSAQPITFQPEWNQVPQCWPAEDYAATTARFPGMQAIYYEGPPYQEKATRIFAYYGIPALKPGEKAPGIVLVHGGGGTAFADWVDQWVRRGYAAIAMDLNGSQPNTEKTGELPAAEQSTRHEWSGPGGWGGFGQMDAPLKDHWVYQSAAGIALAHSLLRSFPEVDADRIGITGISWGGFLTGIAAGLDQRYACAAPVYGCGGIAMNSCWEEGFKKMSPAQVARWNESYDPLVYLPHLTAPTLWVNGTNDFAYWMVNWQRSYQTSPAERTLCMRVNMPHSHQQGWAPKEIAAYMDHHLRGRKSLIQITEQGREGGTAWVTYGQAIPVKIARLHYTEDLTLTSPERKWKSIDATIDNPSGKLTATLPDNAKIYFFTLTSPDDLLVSTEHELLTE